MVALRFQIWTIKEVFYRSFRSSIHNYFQIVTPLYAKRNPVLPKEPRL